MKNCTLSFTHNDIPFIVEKNTSGWNLGYSRKDGSVGWVGTGLFADATASDIVIKAQQLARSIFPVGIKIVGPDTTHPLTVGDLRIVGPDISHPNFIHWEKTSSSFSEEYSYADQR